MSSCCGWSSQHIRVPKQKFTLFQVVHTHYNVRVLCYSICCSIIVREKFSFVLKRVDLKLSAKKILKFPLTDTPMDGGQRDRLSDIGITPGSMGFSNMEYVLITKRRGIHQALMHISCPFPKGKKRNIALWCKSNLSPRHNRKLQTMFQIDEVIVKRYD